MSFISMQSQVAVMTRGYTCADCIIALLQFSSDLDCRVLPLEIWLLVFEYAALFPGIDCSTNRGLRSGPNASIPYLSFDMQRLPPGFSLRAVRTVVDAKDQGWSSYPNDQGSRRGSCTWGDIRCSTGDEVIAEEECFRNIHAGRQFEEQSHTCSPAFVTAFGTSLSASEHRQHHLDLVVHSRYPGWENNVRWGRIEVDLKLLPGDELWRRLDAYASAAGRLRCDTPMSCSVA